MFFVFEWIVKAHLHSQQLCSYTVQPLLLITETQNNASTGGRQRRTKKEREKKRVVVGLSQACSSPIKQDFSHSTSDSHTLLQPQQLCSQLVLSREGLSLVSVMKAGQRCVCVNLTCMCVHLYLCIFVSLCIYTL